MSETGLVYTFTTPKLQPLVTKAEGKNLIQVCKWFSLTRLNKDTMLTPILGLLECARAFWEWWERSWWEHCRITRGANSTTFTSTTTRSSWNASTGTTNASRLWRWRTRAIAGTATSYCLSKLYGSSTTRRLYASTSWHATTADTSIIIQSRSPSTRDGSNKSLKLWYPAHNARVFCTNRVLRGSIL